MAIDAIVIKNSLGVIKSNTDTSRYSDLGQKNLGATINWKTNWNLKNATQLQTYISSYSLISKNESIENNQILNQENKVLDIGFEVKNSHMSKTITFNNGFSLMKSA